MSTSAAGVSALVTAARIALRGGAGSLVGALGAASSASSSLARGLPRAMGAGSLLAAAVATALGSGAYVCATRPWCARTATFWWHMGPILLRYLLAKRVAASDADKEARFRVLHATYAPVVRRLLGELRGMFAKAAQVASVIPELLPEEYQREFRKLQDAVPGARWEEVCRVIERDLGARPTALFERIKREPLGAASLGQAHLAIWKGRRIVVKVQFPDSAVNLRADFDSLCTLCRLTRPEGLPMLRKVRQQFELELDYGQEARHLQALHEALAAAPEFAGRIAVPAPIAELTRGRVLGMEYFPGAKLDDVLQERLATLGLGSGPRTVAAVVQRSLGLQEADAAEDGAAAAAPAAPSALRRTGAVVAGAVVGLLGPELLLTVASRAAGAWADVRLRWRGCRRRAAGRGAWESRAMGSRELRAMLELVLQVHGFQIWFCPYFNADPHPGNILALPDGRVGLIDLGQCIAVDDDTKAGLARLVLLLAVPPTGGAEEGIVRELLALGVRSENSDATFLAFVARFSLCRLEAEWFQDNFLQTMFKRDRIVEQPMALLMAMRAARLLRGFGFQLFENVSLADAWAPYARRYLEQGGAA